MNIRECEWNPSVRYTAYGWFAEVRLGGMTDPYWRKSCLTQWGAKHSACRMARKLRRLDAQGLLHGKTA